MRSARALAPAKVNLGLFLGPPRTKDGKHELVTVMQSISLADELTLELAPEGAAQDEVSCPGLPGPPAGNLAAAALRAFRESTGWKAPPVRLSVLKRIPVAAGMGGGSADAAAALRLASFASGLGDEQLLRELGAGLGADVPAQVSPGRWLATGAGENLHGLPDRRVSLGLLLLPVAAELATARVYAEAGRLGLGRPPQELADRRRQLIAAWSTPWPEPCASSRVGQELLRNDLQNAAMALCPGIADALSEALHAGADMALVSGSGPTVVGLFVSEAGPSPAVQRSVSAASGLAGRQPPAISARPVDAAFGRPAALPGGRAR
jgi:4-diphosphocytidyl-2-C-methyl-D-erythritol kinase